MCVLSYIIFAGNKCTVGKESVGRQKGDGILRRTQKKGSVRIHDEYYYTIFKGRVSSFSYNGQASLPNTVCCARLFMQKPYINSGPQYDVMSNSTDRTVQCRRLRYTEIRLASIGTNGKTGNEKRRRRGHWTWEISQGELIPMTVSRTSFGECQLCRTFGFYRQ